MCEKKQEKKEEQNLLSDKMENLKKEESQNQQIEDTGQVTLDNNEDKCHIHLLTIIGEVEGHESAAKCRMRSPTPYLPRPHPRKQAYCHPQLSREAPHPYIFWYCS